MSDSSQPIIPGSRAHQVRRRDAPADTPPSQATSGADEIAVEDTWRDVFAGDDHIAQRARMLMSDIRRLLRADQTIVAGSFVSPLPERRIGLVAQLLYGGESYYGYESALYPDMFDLAVELFTADMTSNFAIDRKLSYEIIGYVAEDLPRPFEPAQRFMPTLRMFIEQRMDKSSFRQVQSFGVALSLVRQYRYAHKTLPPIFTPAVVRALEEAADKRSHRRHVYYTDETLAAMQSYASLAHCIVPGHTESVAAMLMYSTIMDDAPEVRLREGAQKMLEHVRTVLVEDADRRPGYRPPTGGGRTVTVERVGRPKRRR